MSRYANMEVDLDDDLIYRLAKCVFYYPDDLLVDLLERYDTAEQVVFQLVMSTAVTDALQAMIDEHRVTFKQYEKVWIDEL